MKSDRIITDQYGLELKVGDNVCFTLSMRKDQKPIIKARITEIKVAQKPSSDGVYNDWLVIEPIESRVVEWARIEHKLISKVTPTRVVKCY